MPPFCSGLANVGPNARGLSLSPLAGSNRPPPVVRAGTVKVLLPAPPPCKSPPLLLLLLPLTPAPWRLVWEEYEFRAVFAPVRGLRGGEFEAELVTDDGAV